MNTIELHFSKDVNLDQRAYNLHTRNQVVAILIERDNDNTHIYIWETHCSSCAFGKKTSNTLLLTGCVLFDAKYHEKKIKRI